MRIFIAGATGALGKRLVPMLALAGHSVVGMTRAQAKSDALRAAGAEPVIADGLDREAVLKAVKETRPEAVVHQMTAISGLSSLKHFDRSFEQTNRLRTTGTEYLLDAAQAVGARRFIAQSFTGWTNERVGSRVKTEQDLFDRYPPHSMRRTLESIQRLEEMVLGASEITGIVLRYGYFYGPGTSISQHGEITEMIRKRRLPVVGEGSGVWSFIHIDDAAHATRLGIERAHRGKYNIVDDEPAEVSTWLPELAEAIGAPPPRHVPAWLGKLVIGEAGVSMMNDVRGSSNEAAKIALGWEPRYSSWREGFRKGL